MLKAIWKRVKRLDHYGRAVLVSLPFSSALLLSLILSHSSELLLSDWMVDLVVIPSFIGNFLSGATYIGGMLDARGSAVRKPAGNIERALTIGGAIIGLAVGIGLSIIKQIPFIKELKSIAHGLFFLNHLSIFAGLGNRIGSSIDSKNTRPLSEKRSIKAAVTIGIVAGILLAAFKVTAWVSIVGVTSFFTGGAILPLLGAAIFVGSFSSALGSFADYSSKAINFHRYKNKTSDKTINETIEKRYQEYQGSRIGVVSGLLIGLTVIVGLAIGHQLVLGAAGIVASAVIITTCISIMGGLCSRIGRFMDGLKEKKEKTVPSPVIPDTPTPAPAALDSTTLINTLTKNKSNKPPLITRTQTLPLIKTNPASATIAKCSTISLLNQSTFKMRPPSNANMPIQKPLVFAHGR